MNLSLKKSISHKLQREKKKYNGENVRQLVHNYIRFDLHFFFSESQALSPSRPGGRFLEALGHRTWFVVQWR